MGTIKITQIGDNFGLGVYIPPYDANTCANETAKQLPVNHVVLSKRNKLVVCSLNDFTFHQNNCSGDVQFRFLDANSKNASAKVSTLDMKTHLTERMFQIAPTRHSSAVDRVLTVSRSGKVGIKKLHHTEEISQVKLRKHSIFYVVHVSD